MIRIPLTLAAVIALVALAGIGAGQSDVVAWGGVEMNSAFHRETFVQVDAGGYHTLALRPDGTVVGWGSNFWGELDVPALPPGLVYTKVSCSKGWGFSLALRSDGNVVAWGNAGTGAFNVPSLPPGLTYVDVAAGSRSAAALRSDGSIVAWGDNQYGQLNVPALPPGLTYVEVDAPAGSTLGRRSDGAILVWGYNADGQCNVPALPAGITYVDAAVGYFHILAKRSDGSVVAWGYNAMGQCNIPSLPPGLSWVKFAGGAEHSLGLRSDGSLAAWGSNTTGQCNIPPLPPGLRYTAQMGGGGEDLVWGQFRGHSVALRSDGSVVTWGLNDYFQCNAPRIGPGLEFSQVSVGGTHQGLPFDNGELHALALLSDGSVIAWGRPDEGQCNVPALPLGMKYVEVDAGNYFFSIARRSDGQVLAWGNNSYAQCNVPSLPAGLAFAQVDAGYRHSVARRSDGAIVAWGDNSYGQCNEPVLPPGLTCVEVAASWRHSLARLSNGSVLAWGSNALGQCNVPSLPPGVTYVEIEAAGETSLARRSDGTVVAWGDNSKGQCNVPALAPGLTYVEISADAEFDEGSWVRSSTQARRSDGAIVVWGDTSSHQSKVPVLPSGSSFQELAAGGLCTLARVGPATSCPSWNLARDFSVYPDQANPNPDRCGNPGVWHFLQGDPATFPAHVPSAYTLLPEFITDGFGIVGLEQWQGTYVSTGPKNKLPVVGLNNTGVAQSFLGINWPAGEILVHPINRQFVIVGWRSPMAGAVAISGGVADLQPGGSDGIDWFIDHFDGLNNSTLASGSIPTGGFQAFQSGSGGSSLDYVPVDAGDFLYFLVDGQLSAGGDSTGLDVLIVPATACPEPTNYCIGSINSTGRGAHIGWQGTTSVAQNDFVLLASGCPPKKPGIFFFGKYQHQIPFGEGYLCITGFMQRLLPGVVTDLSGAASYQVDFTNPASAASLIEPGSEWNFQLWYRDPQAVGHGFNLTDALHAAFCE